MCWPRSSEVPILAYLSSFADIPFSLGEYILHPAVLDACFHVMVHPALTANADRNYYYLPAGVNSVILHDPDYVKSATPEFLYSYVKFKEWLPGMFLFMGDGCCIVTNILSSDSISFDLVVSDDRGRRICSFFGFKVARHSIRPDLPGGKKSYDMIYQPIMDSLPKVQQLVKWPHCKIHSPSEFLEASRLSPPSDQPVILAFRLDEALSFPELLNVFRRSAKIWIVACEDRDGFAARGFFRVWMRETFTTNAHLVLFHKSWTDEERVSFIHNLTGFPDAEKEILVDREGIIRAPRITLLPELIGSTQPMPPLSALLSSDGVLVSFATFTPPQGGLRGFLGSIANGKATGWVKGTRVVGITSASARETDLVHEGQLIPLDEEEDGTNFATLALPMLFISLTVGLDAIRNPKRLASQKVLVTDDKSPFVQSLLRLTEALGIHPLSITPQISVDTLSILQSGDIVISGYSDEEDRDVMRSVIPRSSTTFFWNDSRGNAALRVEQNPWSVSDSLTELRKVLHTCARNGFYDLRKNTLAPPEVQSRLLFDNKKAYLLIGGIGSLGIHIALWMYKV
jgi:hypothetical protein